MILGITDNFISVCLCWMRVKVIVPVSKRRFSLKEIATQKSLDSIVVISLSESPDQISD
jgi:hypothetical protein